MKKPFKLYSFEGLHPACLAPFYGSAFSFPVFALIAFEAGLLASGYSYSLPFPLRSSRNSGFADFVPGDSGGTAPDSHGIPY
jgi:hypothetical protein